MIRPLIALAVAALAAAALAATSSAAKPHRVFVPNSGLPTHAHRPHVIYISGDGSYFFDRLHWRSFDGKVARGHGRSNANNCSPTCANGHLFRDPVQVKLSRIRKRCGARFYTRMRVHYPKARPPHHRATTILILGPFTCHT